MNREHYMRLALAEAKKGETPYGAVIVKEHELVAVAYNTVAQDNDPSAHAEINVIRHLTAKLKNPSLIGYSIYTTAEPCPMCAAACIWTGISEIIYGVSIQDLISIKQLQIDISCEQLIAKSFRQIPVMGGVLRPECLALFSGA